MVKDPMRVIEGNARPFEPFWRFTDAAQSESGEVELEFDGPISEYSWWGDEITPKMFKDELYSKGKNGPVTMLVNSPGGEVIAASVIRSILQDYPGRVTADIVGLAASAATIVVTGADVVRMRESALMMIHDPSSIAWGTIDEIKRCLDTLKTVKDSIISVYQSKTGMDPAKLGKMMSAETWMTAQQAKAWGFVDEITSGSGKKAGKAGTMGFANCLKNYVNVPVGLMGPNPQEEPTPSPSLTPLQGREARGGEEEPHPRPLPASREGGEEEEKNKAGRARDAEVQSLGEYLKVFG